MANWENSLNIPIGQLFLEGTHEDGL